MYLQAPASNSKLMNMDMMEKENGKDTSDVTNGDEDEVKTATGMTVVYFYKHTFKLNVDF